MTRLMDGVIPRQASQFSCVDLINSSFADYLEPGGSTTDRLSRQKWQEWFMVRHDLVLNPSSRFPVAQLRTRRSQLRSILTGWAGRGSLLAAELSLLDQGARRAPLRQRVEVGSDHEVSIHLEPVRKDGVWLLSSVTLSAAKIISTYPPDRLKVCGNPNCSWMFLDDTHNHSRIYCSTQPCATLMRVRRHRSKHSGEY